MIVLVWDTSLFMQMILLIKREIFNVVCMLQYRGKNYVVSQLPRPLSLEYVIDRVDWSIGSWE